MDNQNSADAMQSPPEDQGLVFAFLLDGHGGAERLSWDDIANWQESQGLLWVHLDYTSTTAQQWLLEKSKIDPIAGQSLLSDETRPRTTLFHQNALLALRGINLNPGENPEDMVSVRGWMEQSRLITTRRRKLLSVFDIADAFEKGEGPQSLGELLVNLLSGLTQRMEMVVENLDERASLAEENVLSEQLHTTRSELSNLRREAIMLRRYFSPQREAMIKLYSEKVVNISERDRMRIREITDQLIRYIEDLDSIRDRASVTQEELVNKLNEQINARMYVLSMVSVIFLPLGFLTGLLGINLGGIPGAEHPLGFTVFLTFIVITAFTQILFFRHKRWL